ncbi:MAG: hypothetical protein AAF805_00600 [Planctomycetota bacterium]
MIEELAERFRGSPHRWLIVTGVTLVAALTTVLPQVDQLLAERSELAELRAQLADAQQTAERLDEYESAVAERTERLEALRRREVDEAQLAELRSWLVSAAREAGCQVRRIDLSAPTSRPWGFDDHPLATPDKKRKQPPTPFHLETRGVAFSVTGSTAELRALLKAIDADQRLKHANAVAMKPESRNQRSLQLDLNLWYFALVRPNGVA